MMKGLFSRFAAITMGAVLMFALGCAGTKPAKFYTLNSLDISEIESRSEEATRGVALGIGPVRFPDYLNRPQIMTRSSHNALTFAEYHRWAGSLREDFSRILAENLSILLATARIALFPWTSVTPIDYRVTIDVIRFEGKIGGDVTLKVRWSILGGAVKKVLVIKTSNFIEPVGGANYEALVAVQSRALAGLSREIAEAINNISR